MVFGKDKSLWRRFSNGWEYGGNRLRFFWDIGWL